jgi:signal transduction histidine kinase
VSLAICSVLWALAQRRIGDRRVKGLKQQMQDLEGLADAARTSAEVFDSALISIKDRQASLAAGKDSLAACSLALGAATNDAQSVLNTLLAPEREGSTQLMALLDRGDSCAFETGGPGGRVSVEGRVAGTLAWLRISLILGKQGELPTATRLSSLLDARDQPAWIVGAGGALIWANQAWLDATGAKDLHDAIERQLSFDRFSEQLIRDAVQGGSAQEATRWTPVGGQRRAFRITVEPLEGGGAGLWAEDVTLLEESREALRQHVEAHDETLNHLADAVAIFGAKKRLAFHNTAFAELWNLEPAWLAERPSHGEILDRLRQRRRLPETADYAAWKAAELARYESLNASPDDLWALPDGRTLRVVRQPHPMGGMLLLFADITGELRLKAQYNNLIQVQQATLDKLNDAVAVFGADGGLRLHNDAFVSFWGLSASDIQGPTDFSDVVRLCTPRLHDRIFWSELKGRIGDPDPESRAPMLGEIRTSNDRIVSWQSRPLPDGATLIAFSDVTSTRRLEQALADRSAALHASERLQRDFVGNVSYELRTPLTTILGYAEMMEALGQQLPERARSYLASVQDAASQLARSIDDVLDMAALDADELSLSTETIEVSALLADTAARWHPLALEQGAKLSIDCALDVGTLKGDHRRLAQVLDHLVEHGIRQLNGGGVVSLHAMREHGEVQIQVKDSGRGLPYHVQAKIFDRFAVRDGGGPTLGLALVKALVELHGGWVAVESEPGKGATFTCHLPDLSGEVAPSETASADVVEQV